MRLLESELRQYIYSDSLRGVSTLMIIMILHAFVDDDDFGKVINIVVSRLNLGVPFFS